MNYTIKGIKIGRLFITTHKQLEKTQFSIEAEEVWELFKRTVKEGKITFSETKVHKE